MKKMLVFVVLMVLVSVFTSATVPNPGHGAWEVTGGFFDNTGADFYFRNSIVAYDNIGIGTATPRTELDVNGSVWARGFEGGLAAGAGAGIRMDYNARGEIFAYDYGGTGAKDLVLQGPGGNVGIGTASPQRKLHIYDSGDPAVVFDTGGTDWYVGLDDSDSDKLKIGTGYSVGTNSRVTITTAGSVGIVGSVGIGTTVPNAKLEIEDLQPMLRLTDNDDSVAAGQVLGGIEFYNEDNSAGGNDVNARINAYTIDIFGRTGLDFYTGSQYADTPFQRQMRIDAYGNIEVSGVIKNPGGNVGIQLS